MKIVNLPKIGIRETPPNECAMGIQLCRYGASWLNAGGKFHDQNGFLVWMMNIPFENKRGEIEYISQDDAEDAYEMMTCGKFELEQRVREFLNEYQGDDGYVVIKDLE